MKRLVLTLALLATPSLLAVPVADMRCEGRGIYTECVDRDRSTCSWRLSGLLDWWEGRCHW